MDAQNTKYRHIDSLFCDYSAVFTEDLQLLFTDDLNYLHLLVRKNGVEIVNSSGRVDKATGKADQNDLLEIG